jgi:F-type H+-transporting ATPase subunit alpha
MRRMDLAEYRELAAFAQFGTELDKFTKTQLARGQRLVELLKQNQFAPLSIEKQVMLIFVGTGGFLDDIAAGEIVRFERDLLAFADAHRGSLLAKIASRKKLDDEIRGELKKAIAEFKERFATQGAAR